MGRPKLVKDPEVLVAEAVEKTQAAAEKAAKARHKAILTAATEAVKEAVADAKAADDKAAAAAIRQAGAKIVEAVKQAA